MELAEDGTEKEIVGGWYATEDGVTTSVAHWLEEEEFRTNGGVMNHETVESISKRRKPFTVDYTGFGWVLIKKGVFENLEYPWFAPKMQVFESGNVQDMCGEDVSFCLDAKEEGFEIWCDPRIRVGHEKTRVI
jgi:phage I-like protein